MSVKYQLLVAAPAALGDDQRLNDGSCSGD